MPTLLECTREFNDMVNEYIDGGMTYHDAIKQAREDFRNAMLGK